MSESAYKVLPNKILVYTFAENNREVMCLQKTWFGNSELIDLGFYKIENYHLVTKIVMQLLTAAWLVIYIEIGIRQ